MVYGIICYTSMGMGLESGAGVLARGERRKVNEGPIEVTMTSNH